MGCAPKCRGEVACAQALSMPSATGLRSRSSAGPARFARPPSIGHIIVSYISPSSRKQKSDAPQFTEVTTPNPEGVVGY